MKKRAFKLILFFLIIPIMNYCDIERIKPVKIDYFGQNPPGKTPEVFAPGIISTEASEGCSYFSKDGQFYLFARGGSVEPDIFIMKQKDGIWSKPYLASFSAGRHDWDLTLTPDGKYFFFTSNKIGNWDIYWVDAKIIKELRPKEFN